MRVLPFIEEGAAQAVNSPQNPPTPTPTRLLRLEENPLISCVSIDFFFFFFKYMRKKTKENPLQIFPVLHFV